ncbi:NADH dehydrogenase [ubiquinone] iron-sulfur protein 5 [Tupaia chinensis]|uniref:NADH dehydrogenase [ubiquinone] iron-sulfur protein 5 n=1 Tax=Tupaia chinensis TaxID=246437 RepID=L9KXI1_TUPCH|nr:NADH dehydrogenase [ubiquinone] iron-sulfur protein 5 [Tupaia chinensis]
MPFSDVQKRLGLNGDHWVTIQSSEQSHKLPSQCHALEKEWIECAHGIDTEREYKREFEDFIDCMVRQKKIKHVRACHQTAEEKAIKGRKVQPSTSPFGSGEPGPEQRAADGWRLIFMFTNLH